jgi:methylated-DNA-[protein]-cysteine S-methyltransferase
MKREILYTASAKIGGIHFKVFTSKKGLRKIALNDRYAVINKADVTKLNPDDPYMHNIFNELKEYFSRERKKFSVPLDIRGTDFQKKVWKELQKIPFGKTVSYKFIAEKIGNLKAIRAVGRANGTNPVPVVIPCHRVIESNGKIGGYSCGIEIKEKLLELEGSLSLELFENS